MDLAARPAPNFPALTGLRALAAFLVFLILAAPFCSAQDEDLAPNSVGPGNLVNLSTSTLNARLSELERRVNDLQRNDRDQEDRIRQIDREVSELQRRF